LVYRARRAAKTARTAAPEPTTRRPASLLPAALGLAVVLEEPVVPLPEVVVVLLPEVVVVLLPEVVLLEDEPERVLLAAAEEAAAATDDVTELTTDAADDEAALTADEADDAAEWTAEDADAEAEPVLEPHCEACWLRAVA